MIPISCGSIEAATKRRPQGDARPPRLSSSRFVLPFAYLPVPLPEGEGSGDARRALSYRPSEDAVDQARRTYPTLETARVLFHRAGWFRLSGPRKEVLPPFQVQRRDREPGGSFWARIEDIRLVLFEWQHERQQALNRSDRPERGKGRGKRREKAGQPTAGGDLLATGFLLLDVSFDDRQGPVFLDDLLAFNELFRYVQCPFPEHEAEKGFHTVLGDLPIDPASPDRRLRKGGAGQTYQGRWARLLDFEIQDNDDRRWQLFPMAEDENWQVQAENWLAKGEVDKPSGWAVYADSRAYVSTAAMVQGGLNALQRAFPDGEQQASRFGHWIRLLNMDSPRSSPEETHKSSVFEQERASEGTLKRWESAGTVYGFTYHGGALLGPAEEELPIDVHWRTLYFDQTLLLLYLRVTTFRFSRALSEASGRSREQGQVETWRRRFQGLRRDFAVFTNLYQFPLISNQQQGIELYALAREAMDLEELFREVREEILGTHEFFESVATQDANRSVGRLTLVAAVLGTGALVTGFFGMNVFVEEVEALAPWRNILWGLLLVLVGTLLGLWGMFWLLYRPRNFLRRKLLKRLLPGLLAAEDTSKEER